ncbi:MAG: thermonuclease family protein [Candidatus Obscuribacterales bacterium]|nr:thermonuclease family protein [Candidatus Obscuribacterales bacterium]
MAISENFAKSDSFILSVMFVAVCTVIGASVIASDYKAKVVSVKDGDSITIKNGTQKQVVILYGIDCPESAQDFGKEAREFTNQACYGKTVTIIEKGKDKFDRLIADIVLEDGTDLNKLLVSKGLAWWSDKFAPKDSDLKTLHEHAKSQHIGLWASAKPIPPWIFRNGEKSVQAVVKPAQQ